ncbi:hypothetical protein BpHYR1_044437 [Brachionus plicatilis]|uniref:Uncharacterized protein n=1 Tax=Brachionus plicatilis TaxID=10195 RepID=A0A3M7Q141_BRAPC|nr:hypothetical protein BpHYR1_044437 [Brachionus plicatilis]
MSAHFVHRLEPNGRILVSLGLVSLGLFPLVEYFLPGLGQQQRKHGLVVVVIGQVAVDERAELLVVDHWRRRYLLHFTAELALLFQPVVRPLQYAEQKILKNKQIGCFFFVFFVCMLHIHFVEDRAHHIIFIRAHFFAPSLFFFHDFSRFGLFGSLRFFVLLAKLFASHPLAQPILLPSQIHALC